MTKASTLRSGNFAPKKRRSDFSRRTMTGSSSGGFTGTPLVKRCGSRISSSAENELEWPLCGVAVRNSRCSNRSARPRIARVN